MPRRMSFSLTEQQMLDGTKDVTRRLGWRSLRPGDRLVAVRRCMGLKLGEKQVVIGTIRVVDVRRERLCDITVDDIRREGFPEMTPQRFMTLFCVANLCTPFDEVTRIEFVHERQAHVGRES